LLDHIFSDQTAVVKVDRGTGQCRKEFEVWSILEEQDKKYFTPILEYGFSYEIYDEYIVSTWYQLDHYTNIDFTDTMLMKYEELIEDITAKYNICNDIGSYGHNWALLKYNGQPIIYDYGY